VFDARLRRWIDPALNGIAARLSTMGISANGITLFGALLGVATGVAVAFDMPLIALTFLAANRLCDGLDGAIARIKGSTLWGGYLDSLCDYIFYLAVPLGFAFANDANLIPALLLVASFVLTAVSFLALAAILAGRDLGHGEKAFSYSTGLMEGGETIAFFVAFCLFPAWFPVLALIFAGLCIVTVGQRVWLARKLLR
jgi:phosphatidylglycerophosphate synthase